ncbi:MAG: class I SAM-dependent methyltransferase [Nannocystaceae bacterium]|nr:class I SAM-dependent methyltransferase [bacterium]
MGDTLFDTIRRMHGEQPWGRVLDAGTGAHSLRWINGLDTQAWTAVTGDPAREKKLARELGGAVRARDEIVTGNWADEAFLNGEVFDTVLADYLLGALEGFAPYHQDRLFARLRPHVGKRLYVVGLQPYPDGIVPGDGHDTEAGRLVLEIARLRDACILLAGHRCYREYPHDWVVRSLQSSGYAVREAVGVQIVYRKRFIDGQLDVCRRKIALFRDEALATAMTAHVDELRTRALDACARLDGLRFASDYVIAADAV